MAVIAFVAGGAGGAGRGVVNALMARGVQVGVADLESQSPDQVAADVAQKTGGAALGVSCDVTDQESVDTAWAEVTERLGPINVVINTVGAVSHYSLQQLDLRAWESTIAINLTGTFLVCRRAILSWLEDGRPGSITNFGSIAADVAGFGKTIDYGAAKAGVVGLSQQLAVDFGYAGIRTNVVAPGTFRSPMNRDRLKQPGEEAKAASKVPLGRVGEIEDVAAVAVFLALDATYVNGEVIHCDGGTFRWALR
jgi:NAD(P)-dependent dehydrogenase (short-subunit alcohol dehydrogenase family)